MLYKVKASYKYQAEDVDELNFEVGELIHVVAYDDPDEQVRDFSVFFGDTFFTFIPAYFSSRRRAG